MFKKALYSTTMLLLVSMVFGLSSCKKGCQIEKEDSIAGLIVKDVIVYAISGGTTTSLNGDYHIHSTSLFQDNFEISFDGGITRSSVDYNTYSILGLPVTTTSCEVAFVRSVTRDDVLGTATYKIDVYECTDSKCDEQRFVENWVLVPSIPSSYSIIYTINRVNG